MKELESLVKLSKYAGERYDLVQAGSGNSSVKLNNSTMFIKCSGLTLSEIEPDRGYSRIKYKKVIEILNNRKLQSLGNKVHKNRLASHFLKKIVIGQNNKPSIETFLHSLLYKYTLHIHPLVVNAVICKENWREILNCLFKNILLVNYFTPGMELATELKKEVKKYEKNIEKSRK